MLVPRIVPIGLFALTSVAAASFPGRAQACGGLFCDNLDPVVQTAERILFRVNADATVTTIVEIQYEGPPSQFAWVLPVAPGLTVEDISTAPVGLFDALEERTGPVFERPAIEGAASAADDEGRGCGFGRGRWGGGDTFDPPPPDTSGVMVVGEAVVGPYALEIITAEQGANLSNWLILNGYQIPPAAIGAMDHYIQRKMAFLGVKLVAEVPAGPIEALSFTYPGQTPAIPLILTSVAAAPQMEIVAYVAGPGRFVVNNYEDIDFDYDSVRWTGTLDTDYAFKLSEAVATAGGRAFNTEFADVIGETGALAETPLAEVLERDVYVTRFHTFMSAADMTEDPVWMPGTGGDVDNHHVLLDEGLAATRGGGGVGGGAAGFAALLVPVLLLGRRRSRARR
jgi:hypothetical protein